MNDLQRFRKIAFILGSIGFTTSLFICGYALGMFVMEESKVANTSTNGLKFSGIPYGGYDSPYDAFLRFLLITILFLVTILITQFTNNFLLKILNILLLAVICFHGCVALKEPIDLLYYKLYEDNFPLLIKIIALFVCLAGLIVLPAISLIILQIRLFWNKKTIKEFV